MRLLHTGDLHIGKRLHEVSLLEDQQFILQEILDCKPCLYLILKKRRYKR